MRERIPNRMRVFWYFGLTRAIMASVRPVLTGNKQSTAQSTCVVCVWHIFNSDDTCQPFLGSPDPL